MNGFCLSHLPIVKDYASRMGFVETIDDALECRMSLSPGTVVLGLVMNVLCGRFPLYRVEEFYSMRDVETLLGDGIGASALNDDAIGRVLDRIHAYGTWKLFSGISLRTFRSFEVDTSIIHQDTTSASVWGEYRHPEKGAVRIVYGHSKDKRPDLKQFIYSLLCVEGNLPMHAGILDGNASDKKTNGRIVAELPRIMELYGRKDFIYVADSALATRENLDLMKGMKFITRLPENFSACSRLIGKGGTWQDIGRLSHRKVGGKDICACYRIREESVDLYGERYRCVVVHSDVHDKRRQKRIDKLFHEDRISLSERIKEIGSREFYCMPDALKTVESFQDGAYHHTSLFIEEHPVYGRGRPRKDGIRSMKELRYRIQAQISEDAEAILRLREEAGCFVLLTSVPEHEMSGLTVLRTYKEQDGIEKNFGFLKDPLIVNDVFLKKPHRIEAMGFVLILSLLLWRLMERTMRKSVQEKNTTLKGWNNRDTSKPTSVMMASKFSSVFVGVSNGKRFLFTPLDKVQLDYLHALNVHPDVFTHSTTKPACVSSCPAAAP
ncbi:MAG TPA: IS1634 family transposase [Deltaproteobacteria bacterium]|nr:IS1634 family transposase [Deltaproteobacteria bacterium]